MNNCSRCNSARFEVVGSGYWSCTDCGNTSFMGYVTSDAWSPNERLQTKSTYTRAKRFKKYLNRACRIQSCNTVPDETWEYLLSKGPYRGPRDVIRVLKKCRHIKRKCYDSLPLLVQHLCDLEVPRLSENEQRKALKLFGKIDTELAQLPGHPFCSYLYMLEYILYHIGREDVVPYCSRIQCRKRRERYRDLLNRVAPGDNAPPIFITY